MFHSFIRPIHLFKFSEDATESIIVMHADKGVDSRLTTFISSVLASFPSNRIKSANFNRL